MGYGMESNTEYDMEPKMGEDADYDGERGLTVTQAVMRTAMQPVIGTRVWTGIRRPTEKIYPNTFSISECSYTATRQRPARKMALREARLRARAGSWQS